jgi:hypothetical protein
MTDGDIQRSFFQLESTADKQRSKSMWRMTFSRFLVTGAVLALIAGCASNVPTKEDYSGYLGSYGDLKEVEGPNGEKFLRYASPLFTPANYHAVIVEPVTFYPKPQPTAQLTQATIDQIGADLTDTLRAKIGEKVQVVDRPGPGVARLNVAITGVAGEKEGLKPYQVIPVAFVITMASRGISGTPEEAKLVVEARANDSVSGVTLMKVVRVGTGEGLEKNAAGERMITLESVKPLIDRWAEAVSANATKFVRAR